MIVVVVVLIAGVLLIPEVGVVVVVELEAYVVVVVLEVVSVAVPVVEVAMRVLARAGRVMDTFVEVLTVGTRVKSLIIVSNVTVDLSIDALTADSLTDNDVDVLADVNANVFVDVIAAVEFAMPCPLEEFRRWAAFDCRLLAALYCPSGLQAWMPSYHV